MQLGGMLFAGDPGLKLCESPERAWVRACHQDLGTASLAETSLQRVGMKHRLLGLQLAVSPSAPWRSSGSPPNSGGKSPCCGSQKTQCPSAHLPGLLSTPAGAQHCFTPGALDLIRRQCVSQRQAVDESMLGAALQMLTTSDQWQLQPREPVKADGMSVPTFSLTAHRMQTASPALTAR